MAGGVKSKQPARKRPQKTVTLNPRNLEAAVAYEAQTGKSISSLLDDLMEAFFEKKGYLSTEGPKKAPRKG